MSARRPELGQAVTFTQTLVRHLYVPPTAVSGSRLARWERVNHVPERHGVYMGLRTVFDGTVFHGRGWEESAHFESTRGFAHALVVFHPRKAPVRVPFDALHWKDKQLDILEDGGDRS